MIMVGKINVKQYSPYPLHRDKLPSGGEALRHPISYTYRHDREHLDHSMMNKSNCEYTMSQEYIQQIHI